jgi:hypothetical protein
MGLTGGFGGKLNIVAVHLGKVGLVVLRTAEGNVLEGIA